MKLDRDNKCSPPCLILTCVVITTIQQVLVARNICDEKFSLTLLKWENFWHANKSLFLTLHLLPQSMLMKYQTLALSYKDGLVLVKEEGTERSLAAFHTYSNIISKSLIK